MGPQTLESEAVAICGDPEKVDPSPVALSSITSRPHRCEVRDMIPSSLHLPAGCPLKPHKSEGKRLVGRKRVTQGQAPQDSSAAGPLSQCPAVLGPTSLPWSLPWLALSCLLLGGPP